MANVLNEIFTLCTKCTVTDKNIFGYQKEAPSSVITTFNYELMVTTCIMEWTMYRTMIDM